jgi:parallel beta-helix repeat protein
MADLARLIDAIPIVGSAAERDTLFPAPQPNQRVHDVARDIIQRFTASGWQDFPEPGSVITPEFNPQASPFLAVGDGVADDTAAVLATIAAAGVNGRIKLPKEAIFRVRSTIQLLAGQELFGGGTIKFDPLVAPPTSGGTAPIANANATSASGYGAAGNITIRDITIESPNGAGILIAHADGVRISKVRFRDWYHHMVDLPGCKNVIVEGCYGLNTINVNANGSAIQVDQAAAGAGFIQVNGVETAIFADDTSCRDIVVAFNTIEANPQSWGLHLHRTGHVGISWVGNLVRGCVRGMNADPSTIQTDIIIAHNQFFSSTSHAIAFEATGIRVECNGNIVDGVTTAQGIWFENASGGSREIVISNNAVNGVPASGIRLLGATSFAITGNSVTGPSSATASRGIAVVDCASGTVSGNSVDMQKTSGSNVIPGIYVVRATAGTHEDLQISGNHIRRAYRGIWVTGGNGIAVSCSGNVIVDSLERGILYGDGSATYTFTSCAVTGNTIDDVEVSGIVLENPSYCTISGNVVRDVAGSAASGRGIQLAGTGDYNIIQGNALDGVTTSAQYGIFVVTTYTTIVGNTVTRFLMGIQGSGAPLAGTVIANNIFRGNTVDSGLAGVDHFFVMNYVGDQTTPMVLKNFKLVNSAGSEVHTGTGSPEGVVTAPIGSLFLRQNGGAGTSLYVKESGVGNTGWVAK